MPCGAVRVKVMATIGALLQCMNDPRTDRWAGTMTRAFVSENWTRTVTLANVDSCDENSDVKQNRECGAGRAP